MNLIQKLSGEQHLCPVLHFHHHTSVKRDGGGTTDNTFSSLHISCVLIVRGSVLPLLTRAVRLLIAARLSSSVITLDVRQLLPFGIIDLQRVSVIAIELVFFLLNVLSVAGYLNA